MNLEYALILDIFGYPLRPCRIHQEKIADFYETGKPRFEWEKIRQSYILTKDPAILQICAPCPLNLMEQPEGCRGKLRDFAVLLNVFRRFKPDSLFFTYDYAQTVLDKNATIALADELKELKISLNEYPWSAAVVQERPISPLLHTLQEQPLAIYPWDGSADENWFASRDYILLGIAEEGLLLKDSRDEAPALELNSLWRDGFDIYGETQKGQTLHLAPSPQGLPFFEDYPQEIEIKFVKLPAAQLFQDSLALWELFLETAVRHKIGIEIKQI
jgi:hypothetical protein